MRSSFLTLFVVLFASSGARAAAPESNLAEIPARPLSPSAAGTVAYTNSMDVLDARRKLSIGDRVSFRVVEDRKPPTQLFVTDSGEMEVPLIGRVLARGKSCKEVAYEIKKLLEVDYFYRCKVIIGLDAADKRSRGTIYLTGQVKTQGAMELPADEPLSVSKAILRGGGFADFADRRKVRVMRKAPGGASQTLVVDLIQVLEKGQFDKDLELQPDDVVIVAERLINF